jgi:hypothetical protein
MCFDVLALPSHPKQAAPLALRTIGLGTQEKEHGIRPGISIVKYVTKQPNKVS